MRPGQKLFAKREAYKIVSVLKNEGSVTVYKALRGSPPFQMEVIVKVFPFANKLFKSEWESFSQASSLSCCAKLLNVESFKRKRALVLESVRGVTLWELIRQDRLSKKEISHLMNQIHRGLKELASQDLFHGDLSLSNILITDKAEVRFIDFGYGNRETQGTFPFTAPEILKGGGCGLASDLFSLGVIGLFLENPHQMSSLKNKNPQDLISNKALLREDPEKRHFPEEEYQQEVSASSLNRKVTTLLDFKESGWQTRDLPDSQRGFLSLGQKPVFSFLIWLFIVWSANNMSSAKGILKEGVLKIHTSQWFYVAVSDFKGYTPLHMPLSSGHYRLFWKTRQKQGEKRLYIPPGKTLVLNDRDFLH